MPYSVEKRNEFLKLTFPSLNNNTSASTPAQLYLALSVNDPVADRGVFNELSGDTYKRKLIARKGQDMPAYMSDIEGGKIYNKEQITFNRAKVAWTQVKGIGLFNVEENGSPIFYAALKNPVDTDENEIFTFDPNTFVVQFAETDVEIEAEPTAN